VRAADELIDGIVNSSQIPPGKRREIERELRSHIEDFVMEAREAGRDENEIEKLALAHFGDPSAIGNGFAWVYRHERRKLRAFAFTLSTVLLASSLLAAILAMQACLAFGFGRPIAKALASRHTAIEALDILTSVAAYLGLTTLEGLFDTQRFQRAALLLILIDAILIASCAGAGWRTGFLFYGLAVAVFFRAVQLFITPKAARAGIVVVCFPLVGLVLALLRPAASQVAIPATCASWLAMGIGYQLTTDFATRVAAVLLKGLERIQAGY
jgi:hypothetical protein